MTQRTRSARKPLVVPDAIVVDGLLSAPGVRLPDGALGRRALVPTQYGERPGPVVFVSSDLTPHGRILHVSISFADRDPTWAELRALRAAFFPDDTDAMIALPRSEVYVNVARRAFHIWQMPERWLVGRDGMV